MPLYEISNPSDFYTIVCPDMEVAFVACLLLGEGSYGFHVCDESQQPDIPILAFGGPGAAEAWCREMFGDGLDAVMSRTLKERRADVARALDSVLISKRDAFLALAPAEGTPAWREARAKWHDAHVTSFNDIGTRAYQLADALGQPAVEHA